MITLTHSGTGARAHFELRPDVETDRSVIDEVWKMNQYDIQRNSGLRGQCVVDVGANIGAFTVLAAKCGADPVVALEPHPENRARLEHHVKLNGCDDRVRVLEFAVTDREADIVPIIGNGGGAHVATTPEHARQGKMFDLVSTVTLEQIIDAWAPITLLKMDIEGGEFAAFDALDVDELRWVERIVMEWHGPAMPHLTHLRGDEFGELVTKLADAGRVSTFGHPARGGVITWRRY